MRVVWPGDRQLQSFYDPVSHRLSIMTDLIDDHHEGRVYADRVAISATGDGELRDIEVLPGPVGRPSIERRTDPVQRDEPLAVWIPEVEVPVVEADEDSGSVIIRFASSTPDMWIELRGSGVLLGLVGDDVLVAIDICPQVDRDGELESQWLDSIGA